jgi:hypothetical protein
MCNKYSYSCNKGFFSPNNVTEMRRGCIELHVVMEILRKSAWTVQAMLYVHCPVFSSYRLAQFEIR